MTQQTVFVAIYEHCHGQDVCVFAHAAKAEQWRQEVAATWWNSGLGEDEPRPEDPAQLADDYFDEMSNRGGGYFESFTVNECEVWE